MDYIWLGERVNKMDTRIKLNMLLKQEEPKVLCKCLCVDCIYNKDKMCYAKKIELDYLEKEDGSKTCECLTYEVEGDE
mgnify:CR=1 FL=1